MTHTYHTQLHWTGNLGSGTSGYRAYSRDHEIQVEGKPMLPGSSDPTFRGDPSRYNPEDLLVSSLSACHMLWFLHLCTDAGIVVTAYSDNATGTMTETADGSGRFSEVILHPQVTVAEAAMVERAQALHAAAYRMCFIANSCNFPVRHEAVCRVVLG